MKIINSGEIKTVHVLLGFGAGYGTYLNTENLVYALLIGIVFYLLLSSIKSKKNRSKK